MNLRSVHRRGLMMFQMLAKGSDGKSEKRVLDKTYGLTRTDIAFPLFGATADYD